MELAAFFGYVSAVLIGFTLGLIGGGGSILTVPVLVYILQVETVLATAYSLFIVGTSALVSVYGNFKKGLVDFKTGIIFGIPSMATIYATRSWLIPALPNELFTLGNTVVTKDTGMMVLFALLMIGASYTMIKGRRGQDEHNAPRRYNYPVIVLGGVAVGLLAGLVGAGGGFVIVPALMILSKASIKTAIGTSLFIIASNSLIGFSGDLQNEALKIDWSFLSVFAGLSVSGIFIGSWASNYIPNQKLKPLFGYFILLMGVFVLCDRIFFKI